MRTANINFLILSIVLATAYFLQLPAAQAKKPSTEPSFIYVDNVAKNPTDVPPPIDRFNPQTVTVNLYAQEYIAEIAPGENAWVWTFSDDPDDHGTIPGPMIRVMVGDTVEIILHNNMTGNIENIEPHNIDLHASMGPGGGAAVTEIEPGGEPKTLRFKALREGAYIYHCAAEGMAWEHVAYGMYGLIMVEPPGGLEPVDQEFYIAQSDWYLKPAGKREKHGLPADVLKLDEDKALDEQPTMYSFNGHKAALTDPALFGETIRTNQDDTVRFFFVTGGPNIGSNWHIIGTIFDKVYKGHHEDFVRNEETVYVPPGSAAVFELITPVPGKYLIVDHALFRVPKGAGGFMWVDQTGDWPDDIYLPDPSTLP